MSTPSWPTSKALPLIGELEMAGTRLETKEASTRPLVRLSFVSVDPIDRNFATFCVKEASKESISFNPCKLFPRIDSAVTGVDVTGCSVDKEESEMLGPVLPCRHEERDILREFNDVVKIELFIINGRHGTPPSVNIVVKRAPTRGVSSRRYGNLAEPSITTIAAIIIIPATERIICGCLVKLLIIFWTKGLEIREESLT
jgi:hypothetical protein